MADIRQQDLQDNFNEGTDEFSPKDFDRDFSTSDFNEGEVEFSPYDFDPDSCHEELVKMIIIHEYPLKIVEDEGFKNFSKALNPCFKLASRNTIKNDCLKLYDDLKEFEMHNIESCESRVAITTDMYTSSNQKKVFMVVSAHYVDNDWKHQSRIIRCIYVPSSHTSEVLCEALFGCLVEWNVYSKLSTITVDNCSINDAMIKLLLEKLRVGSLLIEGKLLHMRCCAQILNLIVKDGLNVIGAVVEKVRDSISYWSETPKRLVKFKDTARQLRIQLGKKLLLDCATCWKSTYLMLEAAVSYKDVFLRLKLRDSKYTCNPSEDEWNLTKEICGRLKLFYNTAEMFSGTQYPTANLYFPQICDIKLALNQWLNCGVEVVESMSLKMMTKFDKYWSDVHDIMGVAIVFDPRYKGYLLEFYFEMIYGTEGESKVEKILGLCRELFVQYEAKKKMNDDVNSSMETNMADDPSMPLLRAFHLYTAAKRKRKKLRAELDQYLEEGVLPRTPDFDVLAWWKSNRDVYPILHQIARDVLAIPISTVAFEPAFSTNGRSISPHRSKLHHKTIEALMCSRNWLLSDEENSPSVIYESGVYDSDDEKIQIAGQLWNDFSIA